MEEKIKVIFISLMVCLLASIIIIRKFWGMSMMSADIIITAMLTGPCTIKIRFSASKTIIGGNWLPKLINLIWDNNSSIVIAEYYNKIIRNWIGK